MPTQQHSEINNIVVTTSFESLEQRNRIFGTKHLKINRLQRTIEDKAN